jgi:O-antigen ligase
MKYFFAATILCLGFAIAGVLLELRSLFFAPLVIAALVAIAHRPHLLFYLLVLSIPWSIEYNVTPSLGTDLPDELLMLLTAFSTIAFFLFSRWRPSLRAVLSPLAILLILQFVWFAITVIFSTSPLTSLKFLLAKTWYLAAFVITPLLIFQKRERLQLAAFLLAGSMMTFTIFGLLRHAQYGFTFEKINDSLQPFFRNHVNYSALLVCIVPLLVTYYRLATQRSHKWLRGLLILIALFALFLSYARGAWLALIVGGVAYWLLQKRLLFKTYVLAFLLLFAGLFWLIQENRYLRFAHDYNTTIFHTDFKEHLVATYQLKDVSSAERFYRWIAGVRMVKDRWQTGFGPTTFYQHYKGYGVPAFKTWVSKNEEHSTVHNYFLLTIIEQGVIGLILLLLILGYFFYRAEKLYRHEEDPFWKKAVAVTIVIMAMLCTVNFLSDLVETDKLGSLFYISIAIILVADSRRRSQFSADIKRIP